MVNYLDIHPSVSTALAEGKPIVALESTIISHGMPYPQNVETALQVSKAVVENGAVPATCAVIDGRLKAGLFPEEIEKLGKAGQKVHKASRRDLPMLLARKADGATTVASTMIIAHLAGIRIFATGGIGGVHRGGNMNFDISADLQELAHTNVAVVCAGAKSILDIGLTLEYLETFGVPVVGYQTNEFPAFFTRKSGFGVDFQSDTPEEIADMLAAKWDLGLNGSAIIANPVPQEFEADALKINYAIEKSLRRAEEMGIKGKAITPFLLSEIEKLTGGSSLATNIRLILNNAKLAAKIAVALAKK